MISRIKVLSRPSLSNHIYKRPTFNGTHNQTKAKTLLIMLDAYLTNKRSYIPTIEISRLAGVNYRTLLSRLPKWVAWRLVSRIKVKGFWRYHIGKKGRRWVKKYSPLMPLSRYVSEIEAWQAKNEG